MARTRPKVATGRADRIRAHLAQAGRALTARELLDAIDPTGDISNMHGSLGTLVRYGHLTRYCMGGRPRFALPGTTPAANDDGQTTESARIRAWMTRTGRPVTSRQVTDHVLPHKSIRNVSAMLAGMVTKGLLARHEQPGTRERTFTVARTAKPWGSANTPAKARPAPNPAPRAERAPRPAAKPKPRPSRPAKRTRTRPPTPTARRTARGPELRACDVPRTIAPAPPLPARPRTAAPATPPCALHGIPQNNHAASARIAADIAAFEARGGRVERLGPTQFFTPAKHSDGKYLNARTKALRADKPTRKPRT